MPVREPLHLQIDPTPIRRVASYDSLLSETFDAAYSPTDDSSTGAEELFPICSALCLHNFSSNDPDQLSFRRNEVLDIIKQREEGWWAAMRRGGSRIGWIPAGFVQPISLKMGEKLRSMREALRIFEFEAEQLYSATPITYMPNVFEPRSCSSSPAGSPRVYQSHSGFDEVVDHHMLSTKQFRPSHERNSVQTIGISTSEAASRSKRDVVVVNDRETLAWLTTYIASGQVQADAAPTKPPDASPSSDRPWYLRPQHVEHLELDNDRLVKFGTLDALVEKLLHNTTGSIPYEESIYRNTFLATFRSFTTPEDLFERLRLGYHPVPPDNMTASETEDWKEKWLGRARRNVLIVFTSWLEDHQLLEEEPHIARRLTDFLNEVTSPPPLAMTASLILQSIKRLTFATASTNPNTTQSPQSKSKRRKMKNDLLRLDPGDFAEQLTIFEHKLYSKIRPAECIRSIKSPQSAPNVTRFCADLLASWVKWSILMEGMEKRPHVIDFWIKTAEKCRLLNNYNSMFHIVTALSSVVVSRLSITWNHVSRKAAWETLQAQNDPRGGFAGYRALLQQVEGPCVPFILMFLTDLVHVHEQFIISAASSNQQYICFTQRQRYYDISSAITRHQSHSYGHIVEDTSMRDFIHNHLRFCQTLSADWFWEQGERVLNTETHVPKEIKKGLEAAGF